MDLRASEPDLATACAALDAADHAVWAQGQARRPWGVAWSGLGLEPPRRRSPDQIRHAAEARLAAEQAWAASPEGRVKCALANLQAAARALDHQAEALREAASRSPADARAAAPRRLAALSREARSALKALREARSLLV
ncbi:hypothetical protein [Phenylobacterium sp.]|jgi:hypothetical protein|uniref:hypothetical protein n=1 Tax=Phenylobacterium sp. TaxID=1871053 RepID=UPI000C9917ED|nr:hypothetical protein [Phenylobacterium sp.]MAK83577.1 hypothetical protein [Phenylobacterium sp.]|tara:strand:+ start:1304 stop:1720 length:417 start_codon:yes stop_codon:yes gene_type:complete